MVSPPAGPCPCGGGAGLVPVLATTTRTTGTAIEAAHGAHIRRKAPENRILLNDDRERVFLFQLIDLYLASRRINRSDHASNRSEGSSHHFLWIETKGIRGAIADGAQLIADFTRRQATGLRHQT